MRAKKQEIVPAKRDRPQLALAQVVVKPQAPILDETGKGNPLVIMYPAALARSEAGGSLPCMATNQCLSLSRVG